MTKQLKVTQLNGNTTTMPLTSDAPLVPTAELTEIGSYSNGRNGGGRVYIHLPTMKVYVTPNFVVETSITLDDTQASSMGLSAGESVVHRQIVRPLDFPAGYKYGYDSVAKEWVLTEEKTEQCDAEPVTTAF